MLIGSLSVCLFVCLCVIMSTRGWKQPRRRRTFPVTLALRFFREIRPLNGNFSGMWNHVLRATTSGPPGHVFLESLAETDPRKVVEVVRLTPHKNASVTHFFSLSPKPIARFRWKRARLSLFRPQPHLTITFHPNRSKFPRVISENDLPDRYNNRRCRSEIGSQIIMMALD